MSSGKRKKKRKSIEQSSLVAFKGQQPQQQQKHPQKQHPQKQQPQQQQRKFSQDSKIAKSSTQNTAASSAVVTQSSNDVGVRNGSHVLTNGSSAQAAVAGSNALADVATSAFVNSYGNGSFTNGSDANVVTSSKPGKHSRAARKQARNGAVAKSHSSKSGGNPSVLNRDQPLSNTNNSNMASSNSNGTSLPKSASHSQLEHSTAQVHHVTNGRSASLLTNPIRAEDLQALTRVKSNARRKLEIGDGASHFEVDR